MLEELINKIRLKTNYIDDCWLYVGALSDGYGIIDWHGKTCKVHKISLCFAENLNLFDATIHANHKCSNKNCWNPDHLYSGTDLENNIDKQQTSNATSGIWGNASHELAKTHCKWGHEYTPDNTQLQKSPTGFKRKCRECSRIRKNLTQKRKLPVGKYYSSIKRNL